MSADHGRTHTRSAIGSAAWKLLHRAMGRLTHAWAVAVDRKLWLQWRRRVTVEPALAHAPFVWCDACGQSFERHRKPWRLELDGDALRSEMECSSYGHWHAVPEADRGGQRDAFTRVV